MNIKKYLSQMKIYGVFYVMDYLLTFVNYCIFYLLKKVDKYKYFECNNYIFPSFITSLCQIDIILKLLNNCIVYLNFDIF